LPDTYAHGYVLRPKVVGQVDMRLIRIRTILALALVPGVFLTHPGSPTAIASERADGQPVSPTVPTADARPAILGEPVPRGDFARRAWEDDPLFGGLSAAPPVLIVSGINPGPILCLTAAIHGDELNGVEIIRQILYGLDPDETSGTVVGVPIVNVRSFRRSSRYLPDRRDLNRYFPGDAHGSAASRLAHSLFENVIRHCDFLIDIHTGSFHRTNLPQLRADLGNAAILDLTRIFADFAVLNHPGAEGTLRRSAADAGIPTVTLEAGETLRLQPAYVKEGVRGIHSVLAGLGITKGGKPRATEQPIYYESIWIRSDDGGILIAEVNLGDRVHAGQRLATVTDPISSAQTTIDSPVDGRVLGMAANQMVLPGFAAFHLGTEANDVELAARETAADAALEAVEPVRAAAQEAAQQAVAEAMSRGETREASNVARAAARKAVAHPADTTEQAAPAKAKRRERRLEQEEDPDEHPE
jgi:predicted deacylase